MKAIILFIAFLITIINVYPQIADSSTREVKLAGAINFRDLGGYSTKDGRHVKWGKIYRSGEINKLTPADMDTLQNRHIDYIMDFRGPAEVKTAPDLLPTGATRISLPAGSEDVGDRAKMMQVMSSSTTGDSIMLPFYTNIEPFGKRYKPVFETLLNNGADSAILIHCTAGKDRTGIGTALILYALGVDEKKIMEDYLASNYYRQPDMDRMRKMLVENYHVKEEVLNDVMGVKEKYLLSTFTAIKAKYGSVDNFLEKEMGLGKKDLNQLRKMYLD